MFLIAAVPAGATTCWSGRAGSPRRTWSRGDDASGADVLRRVLRPRQPALEKKIAANRRQPARRTPPAFADLRKPGGLLLPVVWSGILLSVFQQFVGINVIFYYSSTLWHSGGFSEADSFSITVVDLHRQRCW